MYDSRQDLIDRLSEIRAALSKVRTSQSWQDGRMQNQRGNYQTLLEEEKSILTKLERIDGGAPFNKVVFTPVR